MSVSTFKTLLFFCALGACHCVLQAADILPYPQALQKAKEEKKSIVVVSDGSDWLPVSPALNQAYKTVTGRLAALDGKVIWAIHDEKNVKPTGEESQKAPKPPMKVWNYPAVQILDSEGRPLYFKEAIKPEELSALGTVIPKVEELKKKRDGYWEKAEKEKGKGNAAIENIAKGLSLLDDQIVRQGSYKPQIERIKTEDPKDKKGYYLRFTYQFLPYIENEINKRIAEKKFAEAYAVVDEKLKLPALTTYQKQSIMVAKFRIAREEGQLEKGLGFLKQVTALEPNSELGKGAAQMARFYTQPVKLDGMRWTTADNRPVWLPMVVDVSSAIKGTGQYKIEFKHAGGNTKFRNPAFKNSSGRVLAALTDNKEAREFTLNLSSGGKVILEVESQGTGWFDGRGDIIVTKL